MTPEDFEGWLYVTASNMTGPTDRDDLIQEGRIALWRAWERADKESPTLAGYLTKSAKGRMIDIVTGNRRFTGQPAPTDRVIMNRRGRAAREQIKEFLRSHPRSSGADISRGTGLSPNTVSKQLRQLWIDDEIDQPGSLDALREAGYDPAVKDPELDLSDLIEIALEALTPNQRRLVNLKFWGELTHAELEKEFGYNPGSIWAEARARMASALAGRAA